MNLTYRLFFILYFVVGTVFVFCIPPFQKPDEKAHFIKAMTLLRKPLFLSAEEKKFLVTKSDVINTKPYRAFPDFGYIPYIGALAFTSHIPTTGFFAGRMSVFLICVFWIFVLFKKANSSVRPILILVASFPVFLQQITAFSYDALVILSALTLFVYITNRSLSLWWLFIPLFLVVMGKSSGYEPFLLLMLFPKFTKKYGAIALAFLLILITSKALFLSGAIVQTGIRTGANPTEQIGALANGPLYFPMVILKTTIARGVFYIMSSIGILGWLEYGIPHWLYLPYVLTALYLTLMMRVEQSKKQLLILGALLVGGYSLILLLLYLQWTFVGESVVDGVQGRYFIPYIPFVLLLFISLRTKLLPRFNFVVHLPAYVIPTIMVITAISVSWTVIAHF